MSKNYRNKYRSKSLRLQNWDYGWNAAYFVTICTKNRVNYFGNIVNGIMMLSTIGNIANNYWSEIPSHFPFVELGEFIVMPNHVHGIIVIKKQHPSQPQHPASVKTPNLGVSTGTTGKTNPKWKPGTLGVIINQYKRITTINARKINPKWAWQSRYYEHIIRDEKSFERISNYIKYNPLKWSEDKFHS